MRKRPGCFNQSRQIGPEHHQAPGAPSFLSLRTSKSEGTERRTALRLQITPFGVASPARDARRPALHRGTFRIRATLSGCIFAIPISQLLAGGSLYPRVEPRTAPSRVTKPAGGAASGPAEMTSHDNALGWTGRPHLKAARTGGDKFSRNCEYGPRWPRGHPLSSGCQCSGENIPQPTTGCRL